MNADELREKIGRLDSVILDPKTSATVRGDAEKDRRMLSDELKMKTDPLSIIGDFSSNDDGAFENAALLGAGYTPRAKLHQQAVDYLTKSGIKAKELREIATDVYGILSGYFKLPSDPEKIKNFLKTNEVKLSYKGWEKILFDHIGEGRQRWNKQLQKNEIIRDKASTSLVYFVWEGIAPEKKAKITREYNSSMRDSLKNSGCTEVDKFNLSAPPLFYSIRTDLVKENPATVELLEAFKAITQNKEKYDVDAVKKGSKPWNRSNYSEVYKKGAAKEGDTNS